MRDPDWDFHCAEFAAAHVGATIGRDVWVELGGCPRNAKQAAALYRRLGSRTLTEAVTGVLGEPIDPKLAMRGDIVMVDNALGVCRGDLVEFVDRMQPIGRAERAWRLQAKELP